MITLPHSDTLTFPTDTEPPTSTPSDTKSNSPADRRQVPSEGGTNSQQDNRADFRSDRNQPTTSTAQEGKDSDSRYIDDSASTARERTRGAQPSNAATTNSAKPPPPLPPPPLSKDQPAGNVDESRAMKQGHRDTLQVHAQSQKTHGEPEQDMAPLARQKQSVDELDDTRQKRSANEYTRSEGHPQVGTPHLEAQTPQDGVPTTDHEQQRRASSEQRDTTAASASRSQTPPQREVKKPQEESVREREQGNLQSDTLATLQTTTTVPQSQQAQHESQEIKQEHSSVQDSKPKGLSEHQAQPPQTGTKEGRESEWNRDSRGPEWNGNKDRSTGSDGRDSSNRRKDTTSHRL